MSGLSSFSESCLEGSTPFTAPQGQRTGIGRKHPPVSHFFKIKTLQR